MGSQKQFEKHLLQLVSEQLSRKFKRILEKNLRVLQKILHSSSSSQTLHQQFPRALPGDLSLEELRLDRLVYTGNEK